MKELSLTATVLARSNFGEADRMFTFLTKEQGLLRAKARGVRKIKSKMSAHLEPFQIITMRIVEGRSIPTLIGAKILSAHQLSTYEQLQTGFLCLNLTRKFSTDNSANPEVFDLLAETIAALETSTHTKSIEHYFCIRILALEGLMPEIPDGLDSGFLHFEKGTISADSSGLSSPLNSRILKLWRLLNHITLETMLRIKDIDIVAEEAQATLAKYYRYHFEVEFDRLKPL